MVGFPSLSDGFLPARQSLIRIAKEKQGQAKEREYVYVRIDPKRLDKSALEL